VLSSTGETVYFSAYLSMYYKKCKVKNSVLNRRAEHGFRFIHIDDLAACLVKAKED